MEESPKKSPFFTVVLIDCSHIIKELSHLLTLTLDSIFNQTFTDYEVIVVESNLEKSLAQVLESYKDKGIQIYHESDGNLALMMNKAVDCSKGAFLHFLYPGDYYLFRNALQKLHKELTKTEDIDLFYSAFLKRRGLSHECDCFALDLKLLQKGRLPSRLRAFWFSKKIFKKLGTFDPKYPHRMGYDMFCRLFLSQAKIVSLQNQIFTDYEYRRIPPYLIFRYAIETFRLIYKYFGFLPAIKWWFAQEETGFLKKVSAGVKRVFWHP